MDELNAYRDDYARKHGRAPPPDDEIALAYQDAIREHFIWLRSILDELTELHAELPRDYPPLG